MPKFFQMSLTIPFMISSLFISMYPNPILATEETSRDACHEASAPPNEIKTKIDLGQWLTYYYVYPRPDLTPQAIFVMEQEGVLDHQNARASLIAFLSHIFAQNPTKLSDWIEKLKALKQFHKTLIWSCLWMANTDEAKKQMTIVVQQLTPDVQASITKNTHQAIPIETMQIHSPYVLDMLWASFFATGDDRYVKRIMTVLPRLDDPEHNAGKIVIASAAKWSLTCNARQHKRVMQICKQEMITHPELKEVLREIVNKAQSSAQPSKPQ